MPEPPGQAQEEIAHVPEQDAPLRRAQRGRPLQARRGVAPPGHGDRRGVHERPRARPLPSGRPAGRGQDGLPRSRLRARAGGEGAPRVRRPGPQPGQQRAHRRRLDGVRRGVRPAVRPPGRRPPRRHHGRLPQLLQAGPELRGARLRGRGRVRAQRHAAGQPAPRHDLRAADADRQDLHGQRRLRRQRSRHDQHGRDPLRRARQDRADPGVDLADQLQLAAALGRPDARRALRVRRGRAAGRADAVHPDGRDVAGHHPGGARAADRRGAVRNRARPADPAGQHR